MERFLGKYSPQLYILMRVVIGLMFACHGAQKQLGAFGGTTPPMFNQFWIGGVIELVGGVLIAVGLFAGYAAFVCSGMMAAAYWMAHGTRSLFPLVNGGELAALYCFVFLLIAAQGAGRWSVDGRYSRR